MTTDANTLASAVHHRMPVILERDERRVWLDADVEDGEALQEILRPFSDKEMTTYSVNPIVNRAGNEGAECVAPVSRPR